MCLVLTYFAQNQSGSAQQSQHWFRQWLGAIRQQAITWANVDFNTRCMLSKAKHLLKVRLATAPCQWNEYSRDLHICAMRWLAPNRLLIWIKIIGAYKKYMYILSYAIQKKNHHVMPQVNSLVQLPSPSTQQPITSSHSSPPLQSPWLLPTRQLAALGEHKWDLLTGREQDRK